MAYDPERHHRRSIRLLGYDYARAGAYFITLCVQGRECLFGEVADGEMQLSDAGRIVEQEWLQTAVLRPNVELDAFIVMPNHVHGIIVLTDTVGATHRVAPTDDPATPKGLATGSLAAIIGQFKAVTTKQINRLRDTSGAPIWQRNYYEYIIRTETSRGKIREYVTSNPSWWIEDQLHPAKPSHW